MLHTKSRGHRPSGSGEEDFLRVFTIYGRGGHLGRVTRTIWTNFCFRVLRSLHMKFEFDWPSGFRGEDVWNCGRTDGRRTDAGVTGILLAHPWAFDSGELITNKAWYFMRIVFMRIVCWQAILMKYHTLIFSKIREDVAKFVVCCCGDWHFMGLSNSL